MSPLSPSEHHFLCDDGCAPHLLAELQRGYPQGRHRGADDGRWVIGDISSELAATPAAVGAAAGHGPLLAFARQCLPLARELEVPSIGAWAAEVVAGIAGVLPNGQPWRLQVEPLYGQGNAGRHRCELIVEAVRERLKKARRALLRSLETGDGAALPFTPQHSLVQLVLSAPDGGRLSIAPAPLPHAWRSVVCTAPLGELPVAVDKAAPARAFAKLLEAEARLGQAIASGHTVVDLGASPGSWSYVAVQRGAVVTAVDRSPLREDLMRHPRVSFSAADAFRFKPELRPVDWLICDVIAAPGRNIELVQQWVAQGWARRFIVTIKFRGQEEYPLLDALKETLPPRCTELGLTRLCANKNEACVFGVVRAGGA